MVYVLLVPEPLTPVLPEQETSQEVSSMWEVILHNDDHNSVEYVTYCLMKIFRHNLDLAIKIMDEAHRRGSAVAEVEGRKEVEKHSQQLRSCGLTSSIRPL